MIRHGDGENHIATIRQVLREIRKGRRFLITTHVRCDGDAIGSELALMHLLARLGREGHPVNDGRIPPEYQFLPGAHRIGKGPEDLRGHYDGMIVVDSGNIQRLERIQTALTPGLTIINIDHHKSNERFGHVNWVEPHSSSVGEMLCRLVKEAGVPMERNIALPLYVSILTDTGRFSHSNTKPSTLLAAAELLRHGIDPGMVTRNLFGNRTIAELRLQADFLAQIQVSRDGRVGWAALTVDMCRHWNVQPMLAQDYVDMIKSLRGVDVAVLFMELESSRPLVKVSFRGESNVDVSALAKVFAGGGHSRAAGCVVPGGIEQVERRVLAETRRHLEPGTNPRKKTRVRVTV